jgi:carbonic anhydrase
VNTDILGSMNLLVKLLCSKLIVLAYQMWCNKRICDHVEMGNLTELLSKKSQPSVYQESKTITERSSKNATLR